MKASGLQLAVGRLEEEVGQSATGDLPVVIGELERLKTLAQAKLYGLSVAPPSDQGETWLTAEQAAKHLQCSVSQIYQFCRMKDGMPSKRFGKSLRIPMSGLDAWGHANGGNVSPRVKAS